MKRLFVITTIVQKENGENQKISIAKFKTEKEKSILDLDLPQTRPESTNLCQSPKTETFDYSRKYSLNILSTDNSISANLNHILDEDKKHNEKKDFLGKKRKFQFNVIKNCSPNNSKKYQDKNLENKFSIEQNDNKDLSDIKKPRYKIKFKKKLPHEKKKNINEGRWSLEERIKFIEAFIENGKKWKKVQENIGSRTCAQTRSHAQKFFLKLKTFSNNEFNFNKDSIKNLGDILEEIKKKKEINNICNINDKKYIIDTLLKFSECSYENNNTDNNNNKTNSIYSYKDNNQINFDKKENENMPKKEENPKNKEKENIINEKDFTINIKNDLAIKEIENKNNFLDKKEKLNDEKNVIQSKIFLKNDNNNDIDNYFSEPVDQKIIFDGGFAFYININSIYNFNNISFYMREYNFIRNIERSKFINSNFFS